MLALSDDNCASEPRSFNTTTLLESAAALVIAILNSLLGENIDDFLQDGLDGCVTIVVVKRNIGVVRLDGSGYL